MDQYYYEEGYIEAGYYGYVAEAQVDPLYIELGYIDPDYYETEGARSALTCDLTQLLVSIVEASADLVSDFTQDTTGYRILEFSIDLSDAFTPSITASPIRTSEIILDSTATMSVDVSVTRNVDITLDTIVNLNIQAAKQAVFSADLSATTDQTTSALLVILAQAELASTSRLITSKYFGTARPLNLKSNSPPIVYSTEIKKFGTASVRPIRTNGTAAVLTSSSGSLYTTILKPKLFESYVFEMWFYVDSAIDTAFNGIGLGNTKLNHYWWIEFLSLRRIKYHYANSAIDFTSAENVYNNQTWNHLALVMEPGNINVEGQPNPYSTSLYINGNRILQSIRTDFYPLDNPYDYLRIDASLAYPERWYFDEISLWQGTTLGYDADSATITVPTAPRSNDVNHTMFLWHVDQSELDDVYFDHSGSALLTSQSTLSATIDDMTKQGQSDLISDTTLDADVLKIILASSDLIADAALTADNLRYRSTALDLSTDTALTADNTRTRSAAAAIEALFTPSIDADITARPLVYLESQTTFTATASVITSGQAQLASDHELSADLTRFRTADAALASTTELTANAGRNLETTVDLSSTVDLAITERWLRLAQSSLDCDATVSADTLESVTRNTASTMQSQTELAADTQESLIRNTEAALAVNCGLTVEISKFTGVSSALVAATEQTASAEATYSAASEIQSLFTPTVSTVAQLAGVALLETRSTLTALVGAIRQFDQPEITGVRSYRLNAAEYTMDFLTAETQIKARTAGWTMSFWAKREAITSDQETVWSIQTDLTQGLGLVIKGTKIVLRFAFDSDEPQPTWPNSAPQDTDWHHYLIHAPKYSAGQEGYPNYSAGDWFKLWIDGELQFSDNPGHQAYYTGNFSDGQKFTIGRGLLPNIDSPFEPLGGLCDVSMAQLWIGSWDHPYGHFKPESFYVDGYQDLGTTGQGLFGQLPQPDVYSLLSDPWQSITWTGSTPTVKSASAVIAQPAASTNSYLTTEPVSVLVFAVNPTATTAMTVQAGYLTENPAALTATATVVCDFSVIRSAASEMASDSLQSAIIGVIKPLTADFASDSEIIVYAGFFEQSGSDLQATTTITAEGQIIPPIRASATLTATTTLTASALTFTDSISLLVSLGTVDCVATVIPPIRTSAELTATATVVADAGVRKPFAALTQSSGTVEVLTSVTRKGEATLDSDSALTVEATKFLGISNLVLEVQGFQLTAGRVINIDPALTVIIEPETRVLIIQPESRVLDIDSETRILTILRG